MTNRKSKPSKEINFEIQHLDRFGQGVHKDDDQKITFVPRTLPGESGTAIITKSKGKVQFARQTKIDQPSEFRVEPQCQHFQKCSGCQFWMTDYEHESNFKQSAFERNLRNALPDSNIPENIGWITSGSREGYRNRIQLHYDKKQKAIGFRDNQNNIIKIQKCLIASGKINGFLQNILTDNQWLNFLRKSDPVKGHIEIYESIDSNEVQFAINEDYAFGGFSQVNQSTNQLMLDHIQTLFQSKEMALEKGDLILDLFGGNGNLSAHLEKQRVLVIDGIKPTQSLKEHQEFHEINLYNEQAPERIEGLLNKRPKVLIIDPPRSGLRNLDEFINQFQPTFVLYISCQYDSLLRDLRKLGQNNFQFLDLALCDLFPATHHVEAITLIKTSYQ